MFNLSVNTPLDYLKDTSNNIFTNQIDVAHESYIHNNTPSIKKHPYMMTPQIISRHFSASSANTHGTTKTDSSLKKEAPITPHI